jgi:acid phosphatase type 7
MPMSRQKLLVVVAATALSTSVSGCVFGHTDDATDLTRSEATLNGHGGASKGPAESWFIWDTDAALAAPNHTTGPRHFPAGSVAPFSARISNLTANTTYFFRACLRDRDGTRCAEIHDFRTLPADNSVSVAAAGDIGDGDATPHMQDETAQLIKFFDPHKVLTLGDNAYSEGSLAQYLAHFHPWWGSPLGTPYGLPSGFGDRLRPVPGNHESATPGQAGYYDYFNGKGVGGAWGVAGQRGKGWYSFTLGNWKLIALDSANGGAPSSEQLNWLEREVAGNTKRCLLAYWHHPRFSSGAGDHDDLPAMQGFWNRLWSAADPSKRADLILNGHNHSYERLARQGLVGNADPAGIVEVIAGTGGTRLVPFGAIDPESRSRHLVHGVLWLALRDGSAHIRFVDTAGNLRDSVTEPCH